MYYRVAGLKKDENTREMIVKASSRTEAEKQIPAAKSFLFPGENTDNYWCSIMPVPIKVNLGTTIPHFRITVARPNPVEKGDDDLFDSDWWETILEADTPEAAKECGKRMVSEDGENPDNYDFYADEMTVEECIREEERSLKRLIETTYFHLNKTDNLSVREYNEFHRNFDMEKNPRQYYEALKAFNKYARLLRGTLRKCNRETCSVQKLVEVSEQLYDCKDKGSFDKVFDSLNA